ncbi:hypothetical protein [Flintibacter muris]|uniref:hypothetical protein n=1 Tax=Flintibacter muris TaxID=2941327 RepID=UPI00203A7E4C|nr:hypothetical protein [Flintibacter muris]
MIKVIYKVCNVEFEALAGNISEAYKYIQAIIKTNELNFPRQEETLSYYMCLLTKIQSGKTVKYENHVFKIEKVTEEKHDL